MRRLLREQDQAGALPAALSISRDAKSRCRPGLHRSGCGGSTPPSCRDWVANFDSEVPALNRRELGANPRRPTISASVVKLSSSSASNGEFAGGSPAGCAISEEGRGLKNSREASVPRVVKDASAFRVPHSAPAFEAWWVATVLCGLRDGCIAAMLATRTRHEGGVEPPQPGL